LLVFFDAARDVAVLILGQDFRLNLPVADAELRRELRGVGIDELAAATRLSSARANRLQF
jgi:hypothetical protein